MLPFAGGGASHDSARLRQDRQHRFAAVPSGGIRIGSCTAAKGGLAGLTRLLACEWASRGVNVNAVAPGYVETNNTRALREEVIRNRQILERIPAGRWAQPSDIAGAVAFLASDAAAYVHGIVLPVDGGWLAR